MIALPFETINSGTDLKIGLNESDQQWVTVQLTDNTAFTGTLAFKVALDDTNFVAIEGYKPDAPATAIETMVDGAATGIVRFDCTGYKQFLIEVTYTSGTVKVLASLATAK